MGKNNKARRAAKANRRKHHARPESPPPGRSGPRVSGNDPRGASHRRIHESFVLAASAWETGRGWDAPIVGELAERPASEVDPVAEEMLVNAVSRLWACGWQPVEAVRHVRLSGSGTAQRLFAHAVAVDHAGRRATTLHHRWSAQVEALALPVVNGRPGWFTVWALGEYATHLEARCAVVEVLSIAYRAPALDVILPPPIGMGEVRPPAWDVDWFAEGADADPVLTRIRNLLAKAESTTFEAEALAFTAKAHELMTRHAIDTARLQSTARGARERPVVVRVPVDAPYADAKSLLLQTVAHAGRCRTAYIAEVTMSSVVGFADDVAAVQVLFTSLLLQVQTALNEAARHAPPGSRTRSQSWRTAFLFGYTNRIADRLAEVNAAVIAEAQADGGAEFLPVLSARAEEVTEFMAERYGALTSRSVRRGYDPAGWVSGQQAADRARLTAGEINEGAA
jgi:Protein of unknown function (DUF2786)